MHECCAVGFLGCICISGLYLNFGVIAKAAVNVIATRIYYTFNSLKMISFFVNSSVHLAFLLSCLSIISFVDLVYYYYSSCRLKYYNRLVKVIRHEDFVLNNIAKDI